MSKNIFLFFLATTMVGVLFAFLVLLPHIQQRFEQEYAFQGIEIMAHDAEYHYAARVREFADGFWATANVFYSEPKDQPYLQPPLPEGTIAIISQLFGLDVITGFILSKAVFAFLLVIIMTGLFTSITHQAWLSLLAVAALLFAGSPLGSPWSLPAFLFNSSFSYEFLRYARPINPQWSAASFFLVFWLLASWMQVRHRWKMIVAALITASLLYVTIYAWSYIGASMTVLLVWYLRKRDWVRCGDLFCFVMIFVCVGLPYFFNLHESMQHVAYHDAGARLGLHSSREGMLGVWIMLFLITSFFTRSLWPWAWPLIPALSLGGIIALNQQIITGIFIVPHHYHWYFIFPLSVIAILLLFFELSTRYIPLAQSARAVTFTVLLSLCITFGAAQQMRAYHIVRDDWGMMQEFSPVLDIIDEYAKQGSVVYVNADTLLRDLIPVYTSADVYAATNATNYLVTNERARDVFFFELWLDGLTAKGAERRFYNDLRFHLSSRIYAIYYRELLGDYSLIPDHVIAEHVTAYQSYEALSLEEKLNLYPLHYIVLMPDEIPSVHMKSILDRGELIEEVNGFQLFSIKGL